MYRSSKESMEVKETLKIMFDKGTESVHGYGVIVDQIDFLGRNLW